jgi:hypothetical protein
VNVGVKDGFELAAVGESEERFKLGLICMSDQDCIKIRDAHPGEIDHLYSQFPLLALHEICHVRSAPI